MDHEHRTHILFESPLLRLVDFRCDGHPADDGDEEPCDTDSICFVRAGSFERSVGDTTTIVDTNQIAMFRAGSVSWIRHPIGGGDACTDLHLRRGALRELATQFDPGAADEEGSLLPRDHVRCGDTAFFRHRLLLRDARHGAEPLAIEEAAIRLVSDVLTSAHEPGARIPHNRRASTERAHRELAEAARHYLARHYREAVRLDAVASAVHHSPFGLSRLFRRHTGVSLHRYLTQLRLRAAMEPLASGTDDLTALALALGFASHSHFTSAFTREFGAPPSCLAARLRMSTIPEA